MFSDNGSCAENIRKQGSLRQDIYVICYAILRPLASVENQKYSEEKC